MPIYEFFCKECKNEFEVFVKSKEEVNNITCPKCKSKNIERLMSIINAIVDTGSSSNSSKSSQEQGITEYKCPTGTCAHATLPGYER